MINIVTLIVLVVLVAAGVVEFIRSERYFREAKRDLRDQFLREEREIDELEKRLKKDD